MDKCSVNLCESPKHCRGYCKLHYARVLKYGEPGEATKRKMSREGSCQSQGCQQPIRSKGYCDIHYNRVLRRGTDQLPVKSKAICEGDKCERVAITRGLCAKHYKRWQTHGTIADPAPKERHFYPCSLEGCERKRNRNGICKMHNMRMDKYGSYGKPRKKRKNRDQVFWSNVRTGEPNECWEWQAALNAYGYGVLGNPQVKAHRYSYEIHKGEIPEGMMICHTCDNRACVNPLHLYAGTAQNNSDDKFDPRPLPRPNPEHCLVA